MVARLGQKLFGNRSGNVKVLLKTRTQSNNLIAFRYLDLLDLNAADRLILLWGSMCSDFEKQTASDFVFNQVGLNPQHFAL